MNFAQANYNMANPSPLKIREESLFKALQIAAKDRFTWTPSKQFAPFVKESIDFKGISHAEHLFACRFEDQKRWNDAWDSVKWDMEKKHPGRMERMFLEGTDFLEIGRIFSKQVDETFIQLIIDDAEGEE